MRKNSQKKPRESAEDAQDNLVWGIHPVHELLSTRPRSVHEVLIQQTKGGKKLQAIIDLARKQKVKVKFTPQFHIQGSNQINHQGVIARTMEHDTLTEAGFFTLLNEIDTPLLLALDSIQDPHNLGAIIRSASAAGVHGLILPKDRSAPLSGTVAKIAAGALEHLPICQTTNLVRTLKKLKDNGVWIYGTIKEGGTSIYETDFNGPVCLVIGSEGKGIRPLVKEQCDFRTTIPMQGKLDSLNASVAAAVIIFEVVRQKI